jgi:hypothetical protein
MKSKWLTNGDAESAVDMFECGEPAVWRDVVSPAQHPTTNTVYIKWPAPLSSNTTILLQLLPQLPLQHDSSRQGTPI